jgi:hypothetical protein
MARFVFQLDRVLKHQEFIEGQAARLMLVQALLQAGE